MKYRLILFDLDGTVLDTSPGIQYCYRMTAEHFGHKECMAGDYRHIIGGSLPENFMHYFGFSENEVKKAVEFYRETYQKTGIRLASRYHGIEQLFSRLHQSGVKIAIATLKREDFAEQMMDAFGLTPYIDQICGMDAKDTRTKADIITMCLNQLQCRPKDAVLIGDSWSDYRGALESGVDFIAVTYGLGFDEQEVLGSQEKIVYVNSVTDLEALLYAEQ